MSWEKRGLVYVPPGDQAWARSHALAPTPIVLKSGLLRIFFASCDEKMIGRINWVDVDPADPTRVRGKAEAPALDAGARGCFDENGVNVTSIVRVGDALWMYYFGYQLGVNVRYTLFSGLAISEDEGVSFTRRSQTPILDRCDGERYVRSAPCVVRANDKFQMWYVSGDEFIAIPGKEVPKYGLRYLESSDGITWCGAGQPVMDPGGPDEYGLGRPFVVPGSGEYRMWLSSRTISKWYRVGGAISTDGLEWRRRDAEMGLDVSPSGWDSEIVCYAAVCDVANATLMFYNGNDYGRTGFGVAVWRAG